MSQVYVGQVSEAMNPIHWQASSFDSDRKRGYLIGVHPTQDGAGVCLFRKGESVYVIDSYSAGYFKGLNDGRKYGIKRPLDWFIPAHTLA